jgi:3-hydroxyisobutyrate dehydrogenase-like beta-hydroxyacid dehydrogenase
VQQFHAVIGSGRMRSPFYDTFMQWSLAGDENAHRFTISNAHKDMRYLASHGRRARRGEPASRRP